MKTSAKVLWGEGLFLRPQHFQLLDRYHESRSADLARAIHPYAWGLRTLKIDLHSLKDGILRIEALSVIFPDGELYDAPCTDDLPRPVQLNRLPFDGGEMVFHLALPHVRPEGGNLSGPTDDGPAIRFRPHNEPVSDLFTRAADADIVLLRRQARMMAEGEPTEHYMSMSLLRIRRTSTGGFELDSAYMPPSIHMDATPFLHVMLRRMLDMLQAKCSALYGFHREPSRNIVEVRSGDIASFWLLHTTSSAFAKLTHLFRNPRLHPERLFEAWLEIAGALMTFAKSYTLDDLPSYTHQQPTTGFLKLERIIRELLETVISTRCVTVPLEETKPSFHLGRLESDKFDRDTAFFLSVSADLPPLELVESVPLRFKLGAADDVEKLVLSAMPGVKLNAAPQVPAAIPVRPGHYYFQLDPYGPLFERMLQSQGLALYVPQGFPELELALYALVS